jgi:hypothetical protein
VKKSLQQCVSFAKFCMEYNIPPQSLAKCLEYVQKHIKAYERDDTKNHEHFMIKAEKELEQHGYTLTWPGLYPMMLTKTHETMLPCVE